MKKMVLYLPFNTAVAVCLGSYLPIQWMWVIIEQTVWCSPNYNYMKIPKKNTYYYSLNWNMIFYLYQSFCRLLVLMFNIKRLRKRWVNRDWLSSLRNSTVYWEWVIPRYLSIRLRLFLITWLIKSWCRNLFLVSI